VDNHKESAIVLRRHHHHTFPKGLFQMWESAVQWQKVVSAYYTVIALLSRDIFTFHLSIYFDIGDSI
jgi:hypothetical protein